MLPSTDAPATRCSAPPAADLGEWLSRRCRRGHPGAGAQNHSARLGRAELARAGRAHADRALQGPALLALAGRADTSGRADLAGVEESARPWRRTARGGGRRGGAGWPARGVAGGLARFHGGGRRLPAAGRAAAVSARARPRLAAGRRVLSTPTAVTRLSPQSHFSGRRSRLSGQPRPLRPRCCAGAGLAEHRPTCLEVAGPPAPALRSRGAAARGARGRQRRAAAPCAAAETAPAVEHLAGGPALSASSERGCAHRAAGPRQSSVRGVAGRPLDAF